MIRKFATQTCNTCFYKTDLIYYSTKTIGRENVFAYGKITPDIRGGCAVAARQ